MTAANDRSGGMTTMDDRRTSVTAMAATGVSAAPAVPTVAAAPADARRQVLAAPVPAWAVPTVVVPAVIVTEPDELRALDHLQAVGRTANCSGRDHRRRAGAHDRRAGNEHRCGRDGNNQSTHAGLQMLFDRNL
jgi:hypothetical protein